MHRCYRVEKEVGEKAGIQERCRNRTAGIKVGRWLLSPAVSYMRDFCCYTGLTEFKELFKKHNIANIKDFFYYLIHVYNTVKIAIFQFHPNITRWH